MKSVCLNGTFVEPAELADPLSMLERNHLFQRIHTFGGTAPFLSVHLEILTRALNRLYGMQTDLSESRIADRIARLLEINRFPRQSACVTLRLFPEGIDEGSDRCEYLIETDRPLLYPHFVLWHKRMMLDTVRCDAPHEGYPTAGALLCDRYAERTVRRRGGELAMRRLVLSACREEGLTVTEYPLTRQMLLRCDEALTVDVQGIVPVLGYRDRRYFNTAAVRLSERINRTNIRTYR